MKGWLHHVVCWLLEHLGPFLFRAYFTTIRMTENARSRGARRRPDRSIGMYAFWHAHQFAAVYFYRGHGVHTMISRSRDGEYIARVAQGMGFIPERGSTSRGGMEGSRGLIAGLRRGEAAGITPDGPRGPRHVVQGGALFVARMARKPVIPMALGFSDYWELPSWDKFRIPKPFTRGVAMLGEPILFPRRMNEEESRAAREQLRQVLNDLEEEADLRAAEWALRCGGRVKKRLREAVEARRECT